MPIAFTREILPERKFRVHQWIDTNKMEPIFGIETSIAYAKWAHVVVGNSPVFFQTKEEAKTQIKAWVAA